jgi:hypothetical protein
MPRSYQSLHLSLYQAVGVEHEIAVRRLPVKFTATASHETVEQRHLSLKMVCSSLTWSVVANTRKVSVVAVVVASG